MFVFSASFLISVSRPFVCFLRLFCLLYYFKLTPPPVFASAGSFDPHRLVLLAYALSVADCFPEEMAREIFSIDFLRKLDAQLESMSPLCSRFGIRIVFCAAAAKHSPQDVSTWRLNGADMTAARSSLQRCPIPSTCGPGCASWSSIAPSVSSAPSSRCRGSTSATASGCKRKVKRGDNQN